MLNDMASYMKKPKKAVVKAWAVKNYKGKISLVSIQRKKFWVSWPHKCVRVRIIEV